MELKRKWVEALLSGKYRQGRSMNVGGYQFCALGVLCDISKKGRWSRLENTSRDSYFYAIEGANTLEDMATVMGFPTNMPAKIIALNDIEQKSFTEIAAWIEENL